jgi:hypothetical protein
LVVPDVEGETVAEPNKDDLTPAGKDPAEGPAGPSTGAPSVNAPEDSHLGPAGDPAEGGPAAGD